MTFSHLDAGTPEREWGDALRDHRIRPLNLDFERLIVLAAHPDDETLGAGGLIHHAHRRGARVDVVVITDGEGSHPSSSTTTAEDLRRRRRREVADALLVLNPDAELRFLGFPDGGIDQHRQDVLDSLVRDLGDTQTSTLIVSPWVGDRHRDHRVASEIATQLAERIGARHLGYPIWLWHWGTPADAPWERFEVLALDDDAVARKRRALAVHTSQTLPLSDQPGDEPILHDRMTAHFERDGEIFIRADAAAISASQQHFDTFWSGAVDPWGFDTRWYEKRKRSLILASLPRERYADALELGCANGAMTAELADRADRVLALDIADAALDIARRRLAGRQNVSLRRATLPRDWPPGHFDLLILSEIGYYWSEQDLRDAIRRSRRSLRAGGHIVACHWRHPIPDGPLDGDAVHRILDSQRDLVRVAHHVEVDFRLDVYEVDPARSPADDGDMS